MRYCKLRKKSQGLREVYEKQQSLNQAGGKLTTHEILAIGFGNCQRRTFLAERYDVSRITIRRALAFAASTVLEVQLKLLHHFWDAACTSTPEIAVASLAWDEPLRCCPWTRMWLVQRCVIKRHLRGKSWLLDCSSWWDG